jgi:regulator of sigma E protease
VLTLAAFLVVIGVLIFVHELGHLLAAKAVDIEVPRFSIGFGPRIAGFRKGETEYVISALPLGGYVRMAGMEDTSALEGGELADHVPSNRDFDSKSLPARALVISAGVLMNLAFAVLVLTGIGFVYGEAINPTTRVVVVGEPGAGALQLAEVPLGSEIATVGGVAVESWNDVMDALDDAPAGALSLAFADGRNVELTLPADRNARTALLEPLQPMTEPVVGEVNPGSPAARAGVERGDRVIAAAGQPILTWNEFVEVVRSRPGQPLELVVDRGGQEITLSTVPGSERELNAEM